MNATAQDRRPMHHLYNRRGPVRAVVGALTQTVDAFADAAADIISTEPPRVGATGPGDVATSRMAHGIYAAAWGGLAYALYTGSFIVSKQHPVLGTIAALLGLSNVVNAIGGDTVKA